jgi:predicted MFS family arabinose efflux permease
VFELLVAVVTVAAFRLPEGGHSLGGVKFDRAALWSALMTRDLWVYGIALLGGYGAYFTTSQLFSQYVTTDRHFDPSAGGLLSALILLAGIPGSVLGGQLADRSTNLRMFVVGPLVTVAALLALIPVAPNILLWPLGIGIGFFLIFGFAAWLAVPARVCDIDHQYIGTATGLMLTLAAVGGFFIPIIFGHLVPHTSFDTGWVFLAIVSFTFALIGLAGRDPATASKRPRAARPAPVEL